MVTSHEIFQYFTFTHDHQTQLMHQNIATPFINTTWATDIFHKKYLEVNTGIFVLYRRAYNTRK